LLGRKGVFGLAPQRSMTWRPVQSLDWSAWIKARVTGMLTRSRRKRGWLIPISNPYGLSTEGCNGGLGASDAYVRLIGPGSLLETPGLGELRAGSCIFVIERDP
jgi:hypothetical protein